MKLKYLVPVILFMAVAARAQIVPEDGVVCPIPGNQGTILSCTAPSALALNTGDLVIVFAQANSAAGTYSVTEDCSLTWTQINNQNQVLIWTATSAITQNCTLTVGRPTGTDPYFAWVAQVYRGVVSVGTVTNAANSGVITCSNSGSIANPYDYIVGAIRGTASGTISSITSSAGNMRQGYVRSGGYVAVALIDATAATAGTLTTTADFNVSVSCARAYFNLIGNGQPPTGGRPANLTDAMQTVLLATTGASDYRLPDSLLSPTWCSWAMPTTSATHNIAPQGTKTLNGQTNQISMPEWQMMRLCQDASGNYWGNPPLVAGSGISITPSSTAITIASTGGGGGGGGGIFASGQITIPGTTVPAGSCDTAAHTATATGATTDDTVHWSYRGIPGGEYETGKINVSAYASTDLVTFRVCNTTAAGVPVGQESLNWQIVRGSTITKIAGGTYSLANENFAANSCVLRPSGGIAATGTQATDVVVLTRQSSASGWGQGRLKIDAIPFAGTISIEICNSDQTNAINPASPLPLNYLVVR